ncbi:hypothetical protein SAMN05660477_02292 [Soonwooa buanensis]|uniref:Lipoprotein n=1 Tax=Soonwooa buanensis TaxID=619805 RepID=A0A1T5FUN1_9FLAO|nr:hypothetical protein [Soonwooa buanensis]SKB99797.1 hypothetical protein SAMN05660477_02292 [Soonwooa buanensis]
MKLESIFFLAVFSLGSLSCQKEENKIQNKIEQSDSIPSVKDVKIGTITVPDDKIGICCITEYYRKGKDHKDLIFMQTGAPDEKGWLNFLNIDGKQIEFYTKESSSGENDDENKFTIKLENDNYQVTIDAIIGEVSVESDSAQAHGIIKVTNKKTKATGSIEFEGGTSC